MKKYITLLAVILVNSHIYAESYVFGGRAHFNGVLVNQSCSISVEDPTSGSIKTPYPLAQIHFSLCPFSIYDNLAIGLSEQSKQTREIFFTTPQEKNDFDKEITIQGSQYISLGQRFIHHVDLPADDASISLKSINIFLNQSIENPSTQPSNVLISIFYP